MKRVSTNLLLVIIAIVGTHALTVGSCDKYSHDGQECLKCVSHYHLYEGNCYQDILGCK